MSFKLNKLEHKHHSPNEDDLFNEDSEDEKPTSTPIVFDGSLTLHDAMHAAHEHREKEELKSTVKDFGDIINRAISLASDQHPAQNDQQSQSDKQAMLQKQQQAEELDELKRLASLLPSIQGQEKDVEKVDVNSLSSVPNSQDYAQMSVQNFGYALLLGQGYKPGEGIGKTNKLETQQIAIEPKQFGQGAWGLGADSKAIALKSALKQMEKQASSQPPSTAATPTESSSTTAAAPRPESKSERPSHRSHHDQTSSSDHTHKDRTRDRNYTSHHSSTSSSSSSQLDSSYQYQFSKHYHWVHRRLRVKIIDSSNQYYKYKGEVVDIDGRDIFIRVETTSGRVEQRVSWRDLETVIPPPENDSSRRVIVLAGKYQGYAGVVESLDKDSVSVRLHVAKSTHLSVSRLDLNDVCEFI